MLLHNLCASESGSTVTRVPDKEPGLQRTEQWRPRAYRRTQADRCSVSQHSICRAASEGRRDERPGIQRFAWILSCRMTYCGNHRDLGSSRHATITCVPPVFRV